MDDIKIKGWLAKDPDNSIWFHFKKPHLMKTSRPMWWGSDDRTFEILEPKLENVPIETDKPLEVEITIKIN